LGGGLKHPYLWVDYLREAPEGSVLAEQVIEIIPEPNRSAHIALVGHEDKLRYIIATENMKPGQTIVTSSEMARIAGNFEFEQSMPMPSSVHDRLSSSAVQKLFL